MFFVNNTILLSHVQIHSKSFMEHNTKAMFYEFVSALTLVINLKRDFIFIQNILANPEDSSSAYLSVLIFSLIEKLLAQFINAVTKVTFLILKT